MTKTEVHIERTTHTDDPEFTQFNIELVLDGEFDKREKIILFNSARNCDVSKILAGKICFQYQLMES
ncbi:MAG: hypothetical protein Q7J07_09555 [Pelolinea sp.]|nr:hypothetical protein [Pelolinea sp.]